jgi:hypothetical protein
MEELRKQVRRAQRRLAVQRFVGLVGWCWFVTLAVAALLILIDRFRPLGVTPWAWVAAAIGLGIVAALVWTFLTREEGLSAAIEIDRRYGLKERVSSAVALPPDESRTQIGQALIADAVRRAARIDVAEQFKVKPPRRLLLPLLPGLAAVLFAVLISPAVVENPAEATSDTAKTQKQVQKSAEDLRRKLVERRQEAEKLGLKDAERLFKRLEESSKEMAAQQPDRKKALAELNDLSRQLQARRQQLDGADKLKQQLEQLKNLDRGPADKFAQAMSKGDFQQAAEQLKKIQDQLAGGKLDEKQKEQLAKQIDQMQEKLNKMAEARKDAQKDLQKRLDQARQAGQMEEASKLEEQLQKILGQGPQMEQLQQLAEKLGQCSKCMKDGNLQDAQKALGGMQAGLQDLQNQLEELEMLDGAMEQLGKARDQMNCQFCGGAGCDKCQGEPGMGLGQGRGQGERPEAKTDTKSYDSQVKQKTGEGVGDVVDMVHGPNVKGKVEQEIQQQFDSTREGSADPLSGHRIPRKLRQHAQEYFDRFREGK